MKKVLVTLAALGLSLPGTVMAQDALHMSDVTISYLPAPRSYQPDGTNYDLADAGKSFDVACVIGADGHLGGCRADNNNMVDQNFVSRALTNVGQWVVEPKAHNGQPTAGKKFVVTCQFTRLDDINQKMATAMPAQ